MRFPRRWLALSLLLTLHLSGCGTSPPNNYYVLSAHDFSAPAGTTPAVGVGPIEVPEYLRRENIVSNRAPNTLSVAGLDLWAEPLTDGIQRTLTLNLAGLLNTQNIQSFTWHPRQAPDYGVTVNLLQLDATQTQATLNAEWRVYRPGSKSKAITRQLSRLQHPLTTAEPAEIAAAYSALVYQLSEIIASAITSAQAAGSELAAP